MSELRIDKCSKSRLLGKPYPELVMHIICNSGIKYNANMRHPRISVAIPVTREWIIQYSLRVCFFFSTAPHPRGEFF